MFSIKEYRDLDLMIRLKEEGPLRSKEMVQLLGGEEYGRHLGTRLAWMRRFGMVERQGGKANPTWDLTEAGRRVVWAKKRAALMRELDELPQEELIEVMAHVTARYHRGDEMIARMLRREFVFGTQPR